MGSQPNFEQNFEIQDSPPPPPYSFTPFHGKMLLLM